MQGSREQRERVKERREIEGWRGSSREAPGNKGQSCPAVCSLRPDIPQAHRGHGGKNEVQAVDMINNSVVFLQRRRVHRPGWGSLIVLVAVRQWKMDFKPRLPHRASLKM